MYMSIFLLVHVHIFDGYVLDDKTCWTSSSFKMRSEHNSVLIINKVKIFETYILTLLTMMVGRRSMILFVSSKFYIKERLKKIPYFFLQNCIFLKIVRFRPKSIGYIKEKTFFHFLRLP